MKKAGSLFKGTCHQQGNGINLTIITHNRPVLSDWLLEKCFINISYLMLENPL